MENLKINKNNQSLNQNSESNHKSVFRSVTKAEVSNFIEINKNEIFKNLSEIANNYQSYVSIQSFDFTADGTDMLLLTYVKSI